MFHGIPERADGLGGDHRLAAAADCRRDHDGQVDFILGENLTEGDEGGFGVEGVEDRLDEEQVGAAGDERADLAAVVGLDLVEGDDAKAGIVGVGRVGEGDGQRPDGAGDVAAAARGVGDAVGPLAALARGGVVDVVGEFLEELVLDDLRVERRVLAAALLAWILEEELALADAGGRKGVGLDDVCAGLEEAPVDVADLGRTGEGVDIAVVLEVLGRVLEALAAHVLLGEVVSADRRAHGAVENGDALPQRLAEGGFSGSGRTGGHYLTGIDASGFVDMEKTTSVCVSLLMTRFITGEGEVNASRAQGLRLLATGWGQLCRGVLRFFFSQFSSHREGRANRPQ